MNEPTRIEHFVVMDAQGNDKLMGEVLERVSLIANVECKQGGDANSECKELQALYDRFKDRGFQIVVFPTDQYLQLAQGESRCSAECVKEHLEKRFNVTFPVMHKISAAGESAHPLFMFLHRKLKDNEQDLGIKWDTTKFLIVDGEPVKKYDLKTPIEQISQEIEFFLKSESNWPSLGSETSELQPSIKQQQQQQQYASEEASEQRDRPHNAPSREVGDLDPVKRQNRRNRP